MPVVANAAQRTRTGLADFFEAGRDPNQDANITYGTVLILDTGMAHFRVFYDIAECEDNDSTAAFVLQKFWIVYSAFRVFDNRDRFSRYGGMWRHSVPSVDFLGFYSDVKVAGRSWKAEELRQKSWEDLHQLWYVCLKEKNMLLSQKQILTSQNMRMPNPERFPKVNFGVWNCHYLASDSLFRSV
jgi:hypothetical protein